MGLSDPRCFDGLTVTMINNCTEVHIQGGPPDGVITIFYSENDSTFTNPLIADTVYSGSNTNGGLTLDAAGDGMIISDQTTNYQASATSTSSAPVPDNGIVIPTNAMEMNGIFYLLIQDPITLTEFKIGTYGFCNLNCCLASLTAELLNCECPECVECSDLLDKISQIYMMMQGAIANVNNCVQEDSTYVRAYEKYLKAKTMCGEDNCNCGSC